MFQRSKRAVFPFPISTTLCSMRRLPTPLSVLSSIYFSFNYVWSLSSRYLFGHFANRISFEHSQRVASVVIPQLWSGYVPWYLLGCCSCHTDEKHGGVHHTAPFCLSASVNHEYRKGRGYGAYLGLNPYRAKPCLNAEDGRHGYALKFSHNLWELYIFQCNTLQILWHNVYATYWETQYNSQELSCSWVGPRTCSW